MKFERREVFLVLFASLTVLMLVLPLVVSFNDFLTKVVENNALYDWIAKYIVPVEAKMIGAILLPLGYNFAFSPSNSMIVVNGFNLGITWNCIGWQSFLLMLITMLIGLRGKYSRFSIAEAVVIGILGTFWLNISRMMLTILLAVHVAPVFRVVFHEYLAAITTIVWLFAFWWFAYNFVLEERPSSDTVLSG